MPALLINIKIDLQERFDLFMVTLSDLSGLFEECHVKIRGTYSQECIEHVHAQLGNGVHLYQELQERDWVAATLKMISQVESRSIFLYFEDHKLVTEKQYLKKVITDFDKSNLDYLCYSFFKASQLDTKNLLPLGATQRILFDEFAFTTKTLNLIGKISPRYHTFSLVSLVSVEYFREILSIENKKYKIFSRKLIAVLARLFPYPGYRRLIKSINDTLSWFNTRLCIYPPSSPFNVEKMWFESIFINGGWRFGIPKQELFANYDDDNGTYEESLMKRGLYPFDGLSLTSDSVNRLTNVVREMALSEGEHFDCTYYSHNGRIRCAPMVEVNVVRGSVTVLYQGASFPLSSGEEKRFYSNLGPVIQCVEPSELKLKVFDEAF